MLRPRTPVEVQELIDLAFSLADRRLVQGELDPVIAAGDHLAHQGGVVRGDVVTDELGHVGEAHHPVVEPDPGVHLTQLDVADHVIERLEEPPRPAGPRGVRGRSCDVGGSVHPVIPRPIHQRVPGVAVGGERGRTERAGGIGLVVRLDQDRRTHPAGVPHAPVDVGHLQADVQHAVPVPAMVVVEFAVRVDPTEDHEPAGAAGQHEPLVVPVSGLRSGVGDQLHAVRRLVVPGRLDSVADHPDDGVPAGDREDIAVRVVVDQPDQLTQLRESQFGQSLFVVQRLKGHVSW